MDKYGRDSWEDTGTGAAYTPPDSPPEGRGSTMPSDDDDQNFLTREGLDKWLYALRHQGVPYNLRPEEVEEIYELLLQLYHLRRDTCTCDTCEVHGPECRQEDLKCPVHGDVFAYLDQKQRAAQAPNGTLADALETINADGLQDGEVATVLEAARRLRGIGCESHDPVHTPNCPVCLMGEVDRLRSDPARKGGALAEAAARVAAVASPVREHGEKKWLVPDREMRRMEEEIRSHRQGGDANE